MRSLPFSDNYTVECWETEREEEKSSQEARTELLVPAGDAGEGMIWRGLGNRAGLRVVLRKEGFTEEVTFGLGLEG